MLTDTKADKVSTNKCPNAENTKKQDTNQYDMKIVQCLMIDYPSNIIILNL